MASCEHRVPLAEVAAVLNQAEYAVAAVAEELRVRARPDWAGRAAVTAEDAARLVGWVRSHPPKPRAEPAQARMSVPMIRTARGQLVPAVQRPGDGTYVEDTLSGALGSVR